MALRLTTIIIALLDIAVILFAVSVTFLSGSDAATKGLDNAAGWAALALFLLTAAPALVLVAKGRAPRTALAFALAFPVAIVAFFVVVVATLP
jgi:hypothetical protein